MFICEFKERGRKAKIQNREFWLEFLLWKFQWRNNDITCLANMLNVSVSSQCLSRKLRALAQPNTRVFQALLSDVVAVLSAGAELWLQTGAVAQRWSCLTDAPPPPRPTPPGHNLINTVSHWGPEKTLARTHERVRWLPNQPNPTPSLNAFF